MIANYTCFIVTFDGYIGEIYAARLLLFSKYLKIYIFSRISRVIYFYTSFGIIHLIIFVLLIYLRMTYHLVHLLINSIYKKEKYMLLLALLLIGGSFTSNSYSATCFPGENIWQLVHDLCGTVGPSCSTVDQLYQCLVGTAITQSMIPYTISTPGNYYLCESVTTSAAAAITINASDVCLNLDQNLIVNSSGIGITSTNNSNIVIKNGSINSQSNALYFSECNYIDISNLTCNVTQADGMIFITVLDLKIEDCYLNSNGSVNNHSILLQAINGGHINNVSIYNSGLGADGQANGFFINGQESGASLQFNYCTVDTAQDAFYVRDIATGFSNINVIFSNCVATNSMRGFVTEGLEEGPVLENCVALDSTQAGFWIESTSNGILRNCIAKSTTSGNGFWLRNNNKLVCEDCISNNNSSSGFYIDYMIGPNDSSIFNNCVSCNNATGFSIANTANQTVISNCLASLNTGSGILNSSPTTFIIDTRSQNGATATNPAYNLNGAADVLTGATVIITS